MTENRLGNLGLDAAEAERIRSVTAIIDREFPAVHQGGRVTIERLNETLVRVHMMSHPTQIRPGGTISGPAMFKIADLAVWVAILGAHGEAAVQAVTTNLAINFLRRPAAGDLIADTRMLKLGRRLAVGDVSILAQDRKTLVAQATATYAMPSQ